MDDELWTKADDQLRRLEDALGAFTAGLEAAAGDVRALWATLAQLEAAGQSLNAPTEEPRS